jgi:hypothetical protein
MIAISKFYRDLVELEQAPNSKIGKMAVNVAAIERNQLTAGNPANRA